MKHRLRERELVVYQKHKHGTHPGPRAHDLRPAALGDVYDYVVDKFWIVEEVRADSLVSLRTPGGKRHQVSSDDPSLRPVNWRELVWLWCRDRDRLRALRGDGI